MNEIKTGLTKVRKWCENNRKLAVLLAVGALLLLFFMAAGELFFDGGGQGYYGDGYGNAYYSSEGGGRFRNGGRFEGHGDGEGSAVFNPAAASYNLALLGGTAFVAGLLLYAYIFRKKSRIQPLPVLFTPERGSESEDGK